MKLSQIVENHLIEYQQEFDAGAASNVSSLWGYQGLTQANVAAVVGTNIARVQTATYNNAGDDLDSDWDHVTPELRSDYEGKVCISQLKQGLQLKVKFT